MYRSSSMGSHDQDCTNYLDTGVNPTAPHGIGQWCAAIDGSHLTFIAPGVCCRIKYNA